MKYWTKDQSDEIFITNKTTGMNKNYKSNPNTDSFGYFESLLDAAQIGSKKSEFGIN